MVHLFSNVQNMTKKFYCEDHLVLSECFRGQIAVDILWEIALILDPVPKEARGAGHTVTLTRGSHIILVSLRIDYPAVGAHVKGCTALWVDVVSIRGALKHSHERGRKNQQQQSSCPHL